LLELLLHADKTLIDLVATYGTAVYAILFIIVFAETGFVGDTVSAGRLAALRHRRAVRHRAP
jgi:hypothetical protein